MSKLITVETLRKVLDGLTIVEDEVVTMISGTMSDYQREQVRKEVVDELRGLAIVVEQGE